MTILYLLRNILRASHYNRLWRSPVCLHFSARAISFSFSGEKSYYIFHSELTSYPLPFSALFQCVATNWCALLQCALRKPTFLLHTGKKNPTLYLLWPVRGDFGHAAQTTSLSPAGRLAARAGTFRWPDKNRKWFTPLPSKTWLRLGPQPMDILPFLAEGLKDLCVGNFA